MTDEYWFGEVSRISPEAPVPVVSVGNVEKRAGAAENVAANCRAMGAEVLTATCETSLKIRVVGRNQQVVRADFDHQPISSTVAHMEATFLRHLPECQVIILSDYGKGSLKNIEVLITAATGRTVLVDPKGYDYAKYRGATLLKPNLDELRHVVGGWTSEQQLFDKVQRLLASIEVPSLLLTRAAGGMTLYHAGEAETYSAEAREVYDVTGAGDTAIAALAVCLNEGQTWGEAVFRANKAAGIVCGKFGTAVATREEVFGDRVPLH